MACRERYVRAMGYKVSVFFWVFITPVCMRGQPSSASTLLAADAFSAKHNALAAAVYPVVSTWLEGPSAAMSGDRFFGGTIPHHELSLAIPAKGNGWALAASSFGTAVLGENRVGLGWNKSLSADLCIGLRLGYGTLAARGYGQRGSPTAGLGFGWRVTERFTWLCQADNIQSMFGNEGPMGYALRSGIGYRVSGYCLIMAEGLVREGYGQSFTLSLEYRPVDILGFRIGYSGNLFMASGFFRQGSLGIFVNASWHMALGFSHGLAIAYTTKRGS